MKLSKIDWIIAAIAVLGLTRMLGYALNCRPLEGIGCATGFAPFTKVFSSTDGYEAFTARLELHIRCADGSQTIIPIDPTTYSRLQGPYMRRNTLGAALVFAPRLPEPMRLGLHGRVLQPGSGLREEMGLPQNMVAVELVIQPLAGSNLQSFTYSIPCH